MARPLNPIKQNTSVVRQYTITKGELPLSCPMSAQAVWSQHPRVYLPIEQAPGGRVTCPYCGAQYTLVGNDTAAPSNDEAH